MAFPDTLANSSLRTAHIHACQTLRGRLLEIQAATLRHQQHLSSRDLLLQMDQAWATLQRMVLGMSNTTTKPLGQCTLADTARSSSNNAGSANTQSGATQVTAGLGLLIAAGLLALVA